MNAVEQHWHGREDDVLDGCDVCVVLAAREAGLLECMSEIVETQYTISLIIRQRYGLVLVWSRVHIIL